VKADETAYKVAAGAVNAAKSAKTRYDAAEAEDAARWDALAKLPADERKRIMNRHRSQNAIRMFLVYLVGLGVFALIFTLMN
jgi:hypothetical protein